METITYNQVRTSNVNRSHWHSLIVFFKIASSWWISIWIAYILAGIVALFLTISTSTLPFTIWAILFGIGLMFSFFTAFHKMRVDRDTYSALWNDKLVINTVLAQMEDLRKQGAHLQILGIKLFGTNFDPLTKKAFDAWKRNVEDWTKSIIETVSHLNPAEAGNITTLGVFNIKFTIKNNIFNIRYVSTLRNLARRMDILAEIRDRWSTRV